MTACTPSSPTSERDAPCAIEACTMREQVAVDHVDEQRQHQVERAPRARVDEGQRDREQRQDQRAIGRPRRQNSSAQVARRRLAQQLERRQRLGGRRAQRARLRRSRCASRSARTRRPGTPSSPARPRSAGRRPARGSGRRSRRSPGSRARATMTPCLPCCVELTNTLATRFCRAGDLFDEKHALRAGATRGTRRARSPSRRAAVQLAADFLAVRHRPRREEQRQQRDHEHERRREQQHRPEPRVRLMPEENQTIISESR